MKKIDKGVVGGGVLVALLAGIWVHIIVGPAISSGSIQTADAISLVDDILDFFTLMFALLSVGAVYRARDLLGGAMGRGLNMIGVGLLFFALTYWPSYRWGMEGSPEWLGMTTGAWSMFFSFASLTAFAFIAYGFFLVWYLGRE
jgi:hypothetical protein